MATDIASLAPVQFESRLIVFLKWAIQDLTRSTASADGMAAMLRHPPTGGNTPAGGCSAPVVSQESCPKSLRALLVDRRRGALSWS